MLLTFPVEMSTERFLARRGRVVVARPDRCPTCGPAPMAFAGWWTRLTRRGPGDIHRVACTRCGATHSLWPDVLVGRRMDLAELIGAALTAAAGGAGHRPIAARLGVPAATVRGWLRAFRRLAGPLCARATAFAAAAGSGVPEPRLDRPEAMAVSAVGQAARAWQQLCGEPVSPWRLAVALAGGRLLG